jgi:hypothetical protein
MLDQKVISLTDYQNTKTQRPKPFTTCPVKKQYLQAWQELGKKLS